MASPGIRTFLIALSVMASLVAQAKQSGGVAQGARARTLKILPASDTSGFNIAGPLQNAVGILFQQTGKFTVSLTSYSLPGFTEAEINKAFQLQSSELLVFTYLEKERLAIFLFDSARPGRFVVDSESLVVPQGGSLSSAWIENRLRVAFNHVLANYLQGQYQILPGSSVDNQKLAAEEKNDAKRRSEEAHRYFRELATLLEKPYYLGASVGMAVVSTQTGNGSSISFGGFAGALLRDNLRMETGIDLLTQAVAHIDAAYRVPLSQQYASLWISLGVARTLGMVSENLPNSTLSSGQMLAGPGLQFRIPLLGTEIRGDLKLYLGGGTLLLGTYGFSCFL